MLIFLLLYFVAGVVTGSLVVFFSNSLNLTIYNTQTKNFLVAVVGWPACVLIGVLIGVLCVVVYYKSRGEQIRQRRWQQTNVGRFAINNLDDYWLHCHTTLRIPNSLTILSTTQSTTAVENEYANRRARRRT